MAGLRRLVRLALAALAAASLASPAGAADQLRVVTFNMLHGGLASGLRGDGERLENRFALAAAELAAIDADVVALQEASTGPARGDLSARLAQRLALPHALLAEPTSLLERLAAFVLRLREGPALLSRVPVRAVHTWEIDRCEETLPRAAVCAELVLPGGPLTACSTHIGGNTCQTRALAALLRTRCRDAPLLVMGDLNRTEESEAMRALLADAGLVDTFRAANPGAPGFTVWQPVADPARRAYRRVDYVLAAPGGGRRIDVVTSRVAIDRPHATPGGVLWPSDHYAVVSDLLVSDESGSTSGGGTACRPLTGERSDEAGRS